jgi:drug/metabolite transporter (DMT)-like permease
MTALPSISLAHPGALIAAVFTPWIAAGILLLIGFFASYLTALSWADLTYVLPATAFGNMIVELLARFALHETISWQRWLGVVLITVGVGFVAHGPSLTERPVALEAPSIDKELESSTFAQTLEAAAQLKEETTR